MSVSSFESISDVLQASPACPITSMVAGDSVDGLEITGAILDRLDFHYASSGALVVPYTVTLAVGKKFSIKSISLETSDADDMAGAVEYWGPDDVDLATAPSDDTLSASGVHVFNVHMRGAKRYLRLKFTPDLDAADTDTALMAAIFFFGFGQY